VQLQVQDQFLHIAAVIVIEQDPCFWFGLKLWMKQGKGGKWLEIGVAV
jgi:hypothetical protein